MRITNLRGRLTLLTDSGAVDVENASAGRFGSDPTAVYAQWDDFVTWADGADLPAGTAYDAADLGPVVPEPAQIFAIGLNYRDHATESGLDFPAEPPVFTKFRTSLAGPVGDLELPTDTVDWESELVVVIGRTARDVAAENAWEHVAGVTVGQDFSERTRQLVPPAPQFSLGKSFPGFSPIGPAVVTVDEFDDPSNLEIGCSIDGETMQHGRTGELIFSIPVLIERLSAVLPLLPGDLIFTGTPSGVGAGRNPKRFLRVGEEIVTHIEGIGELRQMCVPGKRHTTVSAS